MSKKQVEQDKLFYQIDVYLPEKGRDLFLQLAKKNKVTKEELLHQALRWFVAEEEYKLPFYRGKNKMNENSISFHINSEIEELVSKLEAIGRVSKGDVIYTALALYCAKFREREL